MRKLECDLLHGNWGHVSRRWKVNDGSVSVREAYLRRRHDVLDLVASETNHPAHGHQHFPEGGQRLA